MDEGMSHIFTLETLHTFGAERSKTKTEIHISGQKVAKLKRVAIHNRVIITEIKPASKYTKFLIFFITELHNASKK